MHNNTHLEQYSSIIFIQLKLAYIHTIFLCISQLSTTMTIYTLDSRAFQQPLLGNNTKLLYKGTLLSSSLQLLYAILSELNAINYLSFITINIESDLSH
jgi:hypothetical protein